MEIIGSKPDAIVVSLCFRKPFRATNTVTFTLVPVADGTEVTWHLSGEQRGLMGLFGMMVPMDKRLGADFERGLSNLKARAEQRASGNSQ